MGGLWGCSDHRAPPPSAGAARGRETSPHGAPGTGAGPGAGSSAPPPTGARRTYTLYWTAQKDEPVGGVTLDLEVPAGWGEAVDAMGGPSFTDNGLTHGPDVVLVPAPGAGDARVQVLAERHYDGIEPSALEREQLGDGSLWIAHRRADGYVDARWFRAAPGDRGAVICVVTLLPSEASRLEELRRVCATLRVQP